MKADLDVLKTSGQAAWLLLGAGVATLLGNLFVMMSLKEKNATMTGLVEITYPLFTMLFAWLLWREMQATPGALMGGVLIFAGVACVYYFGK